MKFINIFNQSETLPQPGQHATISTLTTFKNLFAFLGLATALFTTVLLMFDYREINKIEIGKNSTSETYKTEKENLFTNGTLMFTSALLMIGYWLYSRAVLILLMIVEDGIILIMRAKQSVSYHFELMWLIILNLLVGVCYMRTIWLDSRFHDEWICTAIFKDRDAILLENGFRGEETSLNSNILPETTGNFLDKMRSKINDFLKPRKKKSPESSIASSCQSSSIESGISSKSPNKLTTKQNTIALSSASSEEDDQHRKKTKHKKPLKAQKH